MGGQIWFESIVGCGTQFWVKCPYNPAEDNRPVLVTGSSNSIVSHTPVHNRINILVAEDNALNQQLITAILRALSHDFTIVENGRDAIEALNEKSFDLVLMDLHMPEMDGLASTHAIRTRTDAARSIPIIGLTASAMEMDRERCLAAGMSAYMSKPFNVKELGVLIARLARPATDQCQ